jgi:riboflavin biosynthesis pyrimidine reductase
VPWRAYSQNVGGGAGLAAQAIAAGLVDEYQLFVVPAVVGGGTRALPDQVRLSFPTGWRWFAPT